MARFYFESFNGERLIADPDGLEFEDRSLMRMAAIASLPEMARDEQIDGDRREYWVRVRDAGGVHVFIATLTIAARWL